MKLTLELFATDGIVHNPNFREQSDGSLVLAIRDRKIASSFRMPSTNRFISGDDLVVFVIQATQDIALDLLAALIFRALIEGQISQARANGIDLPHDERVIESILRQAMIDAPVSKRD